MLVENLMIQPVHTLKPTNTLSEALQLMHEKNIRHIPITNNTDELIGLISENDVKRALPSPTDTEHAKTLFIEDYMVTDLITGHPLDFVEEIALLFFDQKIGCLPIVSNGTLVGILTNTDILLSYIELTGAHKPSSQIELRVKDRLGTIHAITEICVKHRARIISMLIYPDKKDPLYKIVSIRVKSMRPQFIVADLEKEGFELLWPNMPSL